MSFFLRRTAGPFLLTVATLLLFAPALFGDRLFGFRELFFVHYPLRNSWVSELLRGNPPYLNEAWNAGQPILVNPDSAVFYPGNLLYVFFSFDTAWNWSLALHVLWAALGLYRLARTLGCGILASLAGAIAFGFSGPVLSSLNFYNLLIAASWMPWVLALTIPAVTKGGRWIVIAALALSCQLLAGGPAVQFMTGFLLIIGLLASLRDRNSRRKSIRAGAAILLGGLILAAVQLIPTLLWLPESSLVSYSLSAIAEQSLHPARLIELLVPHYFGKPMSQFAAEFWGGSLSGSGYPYFPKIYAGWLPLLLIPLAWHRFWGRVAIAVVLIGLLFSLGFPYGLPIIPEKFSLLFLLGLALAASFGISELLQGRSKRTCYVVGFLFLAIVAIAASRPWPSSLAPPQEQARNLALFHSVIFGACSLALLFLGGIKRWRSIAIGIMPVLLFFDLIPITRDVPQTDPRISIHKRPALVGEIRGIGAQPVLHRGEVEGDLYFGGGLSPKPVMRDALHPMIGLMWRTNYGAVKEVDGMSWKKSSQRSEWIHRNFPQREVLAAMRNASINQIISLSPISHKEVHLVSAVEASPRKQIYVYHLRPPAAPMIRWEKGQGKLRWVKKAPHRIVIHAEPQTAGQLLIARNAIPGWHCKLDNRSIPFVASQDDWLHVPVPSGKHELELSYRPPGIVAGAILTAVGTIAALALLILL